MRLIKAYVLTIRLLAELTVSYVGSESVSVYVRLEATSVTARYVNFYNDTFQRLYDCMRDTDNGQCNVHTLFERPGKQAINYKATSVTPFRTAHLDRSYFTCLYNQSVDVLKCTRYNTSQCGKDKCDSFRLQGSSICDNQCVYLLWTYSNEKLVLNNTTDRFEYCDPVCTTTTVYTPDVHITKPSSHPSVTSRLPSDHTSEATTNSSGAADIANTSSRNSSPDTQLHIIIGVVCSLAVILIIVVGVMYRRMKLIKRHASSIGLRQSHTDTNYRPSHTDANYNGDLAAQPSIAASNMPEIPAVVSLPHSGHRSEASPESEAGYDIIDEDYGRGGYENALNARPSGTAHIYEGDTLITSSELTDYQNVLSSSSQSL